MGAYGSETFDVYVGTSIFDSTPLIKCGDQIKVDISPQVNKSNVDTSDGTRNLINKRNESSEVKFERLDYSEGMDHYLTLQEMIEVDKRIAVATITSLMRFQDDQEYLKKQTFLDGVVVPSESWGASDDWRQTLTVSFNKALVTQAIPL